MVEDVGTTEDGLFGQRVARLRGGKSQKALADDMRERGWKWSQMTVYLTETGKRSLKLKEAPDLADILGVQVMDLFEDPEVLSIEAEIKVLMRNVSYDYATAVETLKALHNSQEILQARISDPGLKNDDRFTRVLRLAQDASRFTFDRAVTKARKRYEPGRGASTEDALEAELD